MTATTARVHGTRQQGGPPLLAPAVAYAVLMLVSVALLAARPGPAASAASLVAYDTAHHTALTVAGCLGFSASVPLAIWTATVYRRLRTGLGITAPGAVIGLAGGLLAAASLGLSGLLTWTGARLDDSADPALARALADLGFATGSAGFVAPLGLLLAGIAVPSVIVRLLPRPLAWAGLVVAAVSLLSTFALLSPALDLAYPVGRFLGLIWIVTVSVALPRTRHDIRRPA